MHDGKFPHRLSYYHWWDELRMHCIIIAVVPPQIIHRIEVGVRAALRFSVPIPSMLGIIIIICATIISRVGSTHGGNICECITLRSSGGSSFMIYEIDVLGDQKLWLKKAAGRQERRHSFPCSLMTTALRQVSMEFPPKRDDISNIYEFPPVKQ